MNNKIKLSFTLLILLVSLLWGDAGILVPANVNDPNAIGIKDMEVIISMDNQFVKTQVIQIYKNNIKLDVEGEYKFVIPEEAAISNFAIWEDGVRIEGVIMEKTKAREIYEDLTWQKIDPGLMESATEIEQINVFTVKVYPIPAFGTKRVEIEYTQNLDINSMKSYYTLPLKPSIMQEQFVDDFNLDMYMVTDYPIGELKFTGERLIPELRDDTTGVKHYNLQIRKLKMEENFSFSYDILTEDIYANLLAFRDVETIYRDVAPDGGKNYQDTTGYFSFKMIYNLPQKSDSKNDYKQVLFLFDNSLSMKWDKLQQAYQALVYFLNRLNKDDKFNVGLFSYDTDFFSNGFVVASQDNLESAQAFVRNNFMLGGTDLGKALTKTLEMAGNAENTDIILISDGHPTLKNIDYNKILKDLNAHKKQSKTKIYTFGIGNDTNISFLKKLADNFNGYFNWVGDTEDLDFKVPLFYDKLDLTSVIIDKIDFGSNGNIFQVYPEVLNRTYNQSSIDLVGKYKEP
ncbi:VWA domain-containing protein, partial [bacterium]|nr:VWA domain-containing protein [bacterium]